MDKEPSISSASQYYCLDFRTPEHISCTRPIILDENYASPETAALHEEGYEGALVARAGSSPNLISMSAYGKPQPPPSVHGFDNGRSFSDASFNFTTQVYGSQGAASASTTAPIYQNPTTMTQMAYQGRTTFDDQAGPYLNVGSTPVPEISSYTPSRGACGEKFYVYIASLYELQTSSSPSFFLMFGHQKCSASLAKLSQQGAACTYTVSTEVPQFAATRWNSAQVPVSMFMETGDGDVIAKLNVGDFAFLDALNTTDVPAPEATKKRKISSDSTDLMRSPIKRISSQQLRPKEEYSPYNYTPTDGTTPYSPYLQGNGQYGQSFAQPRYNQTASYQSQAPSRHVNYGYPNSTATSSPKIKAQSPQVANWSPPYSNVGSNLSQSPAVASSANLRSGLTPAAVSANPPLFRTSTLQQTPSPATTPHGAPPGPHFNAYALYPHKAKLEINGDLDSMAQNWSEEEWDSKRRLVHFRRSQSGSTITTTFQPVSPDERPPNSICISCIYWEEKNECFVTSVDTIHLLEQLVAARFTVEEKNRIRRNLEGFRPLTVSKGKADSEEFFKVIMAFPAPKPRNIEKDVKVFHWKDLCSALKKIIGKYSASPSSTLPPAPALLTPVSSTGYATEASSAGISYVNEHQGAVSPRSIAGSATSTVYASNNPTRVISPHYQKSMATLPNAPSDLRMTVPIQPTPEASGQWHGNQHHMPASQQYQQVSQLSGQSTRGSWDMSNYLENGPATAGGTSGPGSTPQSQSQSLSHSHSLSQSHPPSLNYGNARSAADVAVSMGDNRNSRGLSSQQQSSQSHQMPRT
ncbi:hypothetical protein B0O99DRAFT_652650 [Bisporella sp. PMI_857]|nr:hypothetical protein B0O99DRAFT_652650 [Bisporella sp. PMI_857]